MTEPEHNHVVAKARALYGFLVASAIFTVLLYALLIQHANDSRKNCEQRNMQFQEVNERAPLLNYLIRLEREEKGEHTREQLAVLHGLKAAPVPLTDCDDDFPYPWPVG